MKVYILLTDTGTVFTRAIKMYTKQPYNHVSIAFDEDLSQVYSFGRKRPRNPFIGGFVQEELRNDVFINARCAVYSCEVTKEQYDKMVARVQEIEEEKDLYRYNLLGVLAVAMNLNINRKNAYFCSQFVATILKEGEIKFDKPTQFVAPHDIQQYPKFQLEYEGYLKSYSFFRKLQFGM